MGYDAACTIRIADRTGTGKASLEQAALVFRGPFRVAVPLADVTEAVARDGTLVVRFGEARAELDIGEAAERWARRITHPPSRLNKLGIKPGMCVRLVNLPDPAFREEIAGAGATVLARSAANTDAIFLGAETPGDLERLSMLSRTLRPAGAVWVVRRKGRTAVTEQQSMAAGKRAGLVDVKVVAFSETHTAEKYVIPLARRAAAVRPASAPPRTRGPAPSRGRS